MKQIIIKCIKSISFGLSLILLSLIFNIYLISISTSINKSTEHPIDLSTDILFAEEVNLIHNELEEIIYPINVSQEITEWEIFYLALIWVESRGDETAVNKYSGATGHIQSLKEGCGGFLDEANRLLGYKEYSNIDLVNARRSREIFDIVNDHYNPNYSIDKAIKLHNPLAGASYKNSIMTKYNQLVKEYTNNNYIIVKS